LDLSRVDLPTRSVVLAILTLLFLMSAEVVAETDGGHIWSRSGKAIAGKLLRKACVLPMADML